MYTTVENNKRIAKNTLLLYGRMMLLLLISLYTSRVILNALGINDYGIYNVVGGLVSMFSMLSGSFSAAITRFITYELGKEQHNNRLNAIFCTSINIQLIISLVVLVTAEIVGIWFLNYKMNIPENRIVAANWVLQCAIGSFIFNLISVSYNAEIIAHERMGVFAVISILEGVFKLLIAYLIIITPFDKLKTYAFFYLLVAIIIRSIYNLYCNNHFEECKFHWVFDKDIFKEMGKFAGWNFLGSIAYMMNTQGVNMVMNMYFGIAVNAARGIATQVDSVMRQFTNNFMTAVNPQITKSYSGGEMDYMYKLVCRSAKFSSFLFLFVAVPIVLETPIILKIWLKTVPNYTVVFLRLLVFATYIDAILGTSSWTAIMASGKIRKYQITVATVGILVFPLSWLFFHLGYGPEVTYIIFIIIYCFVLMIRLYFMKNQLGMSIIMFIKDVLFRVIPVTAIAFTLPMLIQYNMKYGIVRLLVICVSNVVITSFLSYSLGLTSHERTMITEKTINKINHLVKHKNDNNTEY